MEKLLIAALVLLVLVILGLILIVAGFIGEGISDWDPWPWCVTGALFILAGQTGVLVLRVFLVIMDAGYPAHVMPVFCISVAGIVISFILSVAGVFWAEYKLKISDILLRIGLAGIIAGAILVVIAVILCVSF